MFILTNAFSLNMLDDASEHNVKIKKLSLASARIAAANLDKNAIGHQDTAAVVENVLTNGEGGLPTAERSTVVMDNDTELLVAQYRGPRLEEGAVVLPEGATIEFYTVYAERVPS